MFDCRENYLTTYKHHYRTINGTKPPKIMKKLVQTDEALVSNHFRNTLQVNGRQVKSKIWPKTLIGVEEYKDFVQRLEKCKKEVFKHYFESPDVRSDIIEQMLKDLEKSTYQYSYSPNEFRSRKESRRYAKIAAEKTNMKYYATTYGTYYNRIQELMRFKDSLYGMMRKEEKEYIKNELRKIYKTGVTTYHVEYNVPATEASKKKNLLDGPIDQYTLRRW